MSALCGWLMTLPRRGCNSWSSQVNISAPTRGLELSLSMYRARLPVIFLWLRFSLMIEIIFEVREDEADGGFTASAVSGGIHTEGETLEELRQNVREAVDCYFDDPAQAPKMIRLHLVRDEVLTR